MRQQVLERDGGCIVCGTREELEVHHVVGAADGGPTTPSNCVVLSRAPEELAREINLHGPDWSPEYEVRDFTRDGPDIWKKTEEGTAVQVDWRRCPACGIGST